jgi:predicted DNA-binding protein
MKKNSQPFSFRIDNETLEKLKQLAIENCRTMTKEIEYLIQQAYKKTIK